MRFLLTILALTLALTATAQTPAFNVAPATAAAKGPQITGSMQIVYNTRTQRDGDKPKAGVSDRYTLNLNVADSALFKGTIDHLPFVKNRVTKNQLGQLVYGLELHVVNPANPAQTRAVGRLYGAVGIDDQNVYRFAEGSVQVAVNDMGAAKGFESRFSGFAHGKPPVETGFIAKVAKQAQTITRQVGGKTVAITVKRYDSMEFKNLVVAAGPVKRYPEVTANGVMLYDYDRSCWIFQGVTLGYVAADGRPSVDRLSGTIRWVEAANRKSTGEGSYELDIRVNEPPPSETSVFSAAADEGAFFQVDNEVPALTGTMRYKDAISGDVVNSSNVTIALSGNRLSTAQVMNLGKVLFLVAVVSINAE